MIITRTPLRLSLGGGGTDLPSYYQEFGGSRHLGGHQQVRLRYSESQFLPRLHS